MNYQTDDQGNLYDEQGNFLAYNGEYNIDENGNVIILPQNTNRQAIDQIQENINQEQKISKVQTEEKSIFSKISDFFSSLTGSKKSNDDMSQDVGIAIKGDEEIKYEDKFPAELTPQEDLRRFMENLNNISKIFISDSRDNVARWKLFFINQKDVVGFLDQLSTLVNAGIRLIDAIKIIKNQTESYSLKLLYGSIENKLNNGKHLSESLQDYDYIFPVKWVKLILAAEASGQMDVVLKDLAHEEEKQIQFVSKIRSAMIYPSILVIMAVGVFVLMMLKIVPVLEKSFSGQDNLPELTKMVINMSHYLQEHYIIIFAYPIIFLMVVSMLNSQFVTLQKIINWIVLRVPVFGMVSKRKNIVIFAQNFSLLLKSGVLVSESLKILAQIVPSVLYQQEIHKMRRGVESGIVISKMMGITDSGELGKANENFYFPLEIAQMMKIGEETGNTVDILKKILEMNNEKLDSTVKNLTTILEPIATVIIGLMVGTLLLAFFVPMMSSFKNVS